MAPQDEPEVKAAEARRARRKTLDGFLVGVAVALGAVYLAFQLVRLFLSP
jgi:hypothetical protein